METGININNIGLSFKVKRMKRLLSFLFIITFFITPSCAQKKQISDARDQIKSRSKLDKAEASMRELLKKQENKDNIKIYTTLAEAVRAQYEVANEAFYLKQKSDTATLFLTARKMFLAYEALDSVDMRLNSNGKKKPEYRKRNAIELDAYRPNLYNGGLYFVRKNDYANAFAMFDAYLQCASQPLFTTQHYSLTDSLAQTAAFWTVFCGFKVSDAAKALAYKDIALAGKNYRERTQVYLAETYKLKKDTVLYFETLNTGFKENPSSEFFFTRIMDWYNDKGSYDTALSIADKAVKSDPSSSLFLFAKSNALLNLGRYAECLVVCDTLIARKETLPDVYFNAGVAYVNMATQLENNHDADQKTRNRITAYYKMALPYMEKYRKLAPNQQKNWAPSLYNIYLKLNMGRQFEEISNLLRKSDE